MEYKGFVGPTYQTLSRAVSSDRCVNWYPEIVPTGVGKSGINYYPTPGLVQLADLSALGEGRGAFALNGRQYAVIGGMLIEFLADGTATQLGSVNNDGKPVFFAANSKTPSQIMVASAGTAYAYDSGDTVSPIGGEFEGSAICAFLDGYLVALKPLSRQIQISGINDGLNWSALDVSNNGGSADLLIGITTDHEYLYLMGSKRIAVYANSGNADFPITPVSGAFIEQGIKAAASLRRADNTLIWLGQNENGGDVAYRAEGFVPKRISTHAVEQAWQKYPRTDDATAYVVQRNGHTEYRITFPTADATWVYDISTDMWHERASFDSATGTLHAQTQRFHCYSAGVHYFVGIDGIIYREDETVFSDAGRPIKRLRVGPVVYNANKLLFISRLEVVAEPGIGLDGNLGAQGANPKMVLRYSGDGGRHWSNEVTANGGLIGGYQARMIWDRLGCGRAWMAEISTTDPNNWCIVGAEIDLKAGKY